jgi:hypothetical protein
LPIVEILPRTLAPGVLTDLIPENVRATEVLRKRRGPGRRTVRAAEISTVVQ